jgi:hypothetical protein
VKRFNPDHWFSRIGALQGLAADNQFDVRSMWIRHFVFGYDRRSKGREGAEAVRQDH